MEQRSGLRRCEWVAVIGCVTLGMTLLGCIGQSSRRHVEASGCQANLRQWHGIFEDYIQENDGRLFRKPSASGWYWITGLQPEHRDWKRTTIWLCPLAATPIIGEDGTARRVSGVFDAWGIYQGDDYGPNGLAGSYGLNGYAVNIGDGREYEGHIPAEEGWRDLRVVPSPERVPLFIDALRFDLCPKASEGPAAREDAAWSANNMARCCINRHDGTVNCLFVDGSVRKVGLKELWTLQWHKAFNTAGPWTRAGGVLPEDWPEWIRPFKDY